ncbi:MAG: alpha/beta fold hydrolase [Promethearchaeota archaeon]
MKFISQFFKIDDISLHYKCEQKETEKKPLLLFHGYNPHNNSWRVWEQNLVGFVEFFSPYPIDLVGFGDSSKEAPFSIHDKTRQVEIVSMFIKTLKSKFFAVGGLSWGGTIGNELVKLFPDRISFCLLVSTTLTPTTLASEIKEGLIPTILVGCPQDPLVSFNNSIELAKIIPKSRIIEINAPSKLDMPPRAHHIQSLCPEEFNKRIGKEFRQILNIK